MVDCFLYKAKRNISKATSNYIKLFSYLIIYLMETVMIVFWPLKLTMTFKIYITNLMGDVIVIIIW